MKMKIREIIVEEQVQWVLTYVQRKTTDFWKENILEDLEMGILEFEIVGEFLKEIKEKFGRGSKKLRKVAELKQVEQGQ